MLLCSLKYERFFNVNAKIDNKQVLKFEEEFLISLDHGRVGQSLHFLRLNIVLIFTPFLAVFHESVVRKSLSSWQVQRFPSLYLCELSRILEEMVRTSTQSLRRRCANCNPLLCFVLNGFRLLKPSREVIKVNAQNMTEEPLRVFIWEKLTSSVFRLCYAYNAY